MNRQRQIKTRGFPILIGTVNPKLIVAAVLLTLMGILWLRVFLRGRTGPARAQAQSASPAPAADAAAKPAVLHPVSLPVEAGRHDHLQGNPFVLDRSRWAQAAAPSLPEEGSSADAGEQKHRTNLHRISQRLVLEAIVRDPDGVPIKACVDGKVLFKGSLFKVKENGEIYELNVTEISATEVKLAWQVYDLTVKMPSSEWLD